MPSLHVLHMEHPVSLQYVPWLQGVHADVDVHSPDPGQTLHADFAETQGPKFLVFDIQLVVNKIAQTNFNKNFNGQ